MDNEPKGAGLGALMTSNDLFEDLPHNKAILDRLVEDLPAPPEPELAYEFCGFRWADHNRLYLIIKSCEEIHSIPIEINQLHLIVHDAAEILHGLPCSERIVDFSRADTVH